jgi:uncharacterized protein
MIFEWDREKAEQNQRKHKVSFEEALSIFRDPFSVTFDDPEHSIDERRFITIGYSVVGRLLIISHVERGDIVRIISARPATAQERMRHER